MRLVRGAVSGAVGTVAMSIPMLLARRAGVSARLPPEVITSKALNLPKGPILEATATVAHLGFGAAGGVLLSLLPAARRGKPHSILAGAGTGASIWAASYAGWIPALGLLPPPDDDDPGRRRTMILSHLVFGVVTALVFRWLENRGGSDAGAGHIVTPTAPSADVAAPAAPDRPTDGDQASRVPVDESASQAHQDSDPASGATDR